MWQLIEITPRFLKIFFACVLFCSWFPETWFNQKEFFFDSRQCRYQEGMIMVSHKVFTPVLQNAPQWGTCHHLLKLTDLLSCDSVITILQIGFYTAAWDPWHHFKVCLGCIFLCLVYNLSEQIVLWCNSFRSWPHWLLVKAVR